jgi:5-methylcytosine-specific restriction endonuclease McrA
MTPLVEKNINYICIEIIGQWKDTQNGGGIQTTNKSAGMPHRAYINIQDVKRKLRKVPKICENYEKLKRNVFYANENLQNKFMFKYLDDNSTDFCNKHGCWLGMVPNFTDYFEDYVAPEISSSSSGYETEDEGPSYSYWEPPKKPWYTYFNKTGSSSDEYSSSEEESEDEKTGHAFPTIRKHLWYSYFDKTTGTCYVCARKITIKKKNNNTFHASHVRARANGGNDELKNLRPCCETCNLKMNTQDLEEYKKENYPKVKKIYPKK